MHILAICIATVLPMSAASQAQEKPKATEESKTVVPLRIQVVISEYEGEKKLSNFPYSLPVNAEHQPSPRQSQLRMGIRVPVLVQGKEVQFQYQDVGTDIDCSAQEMEDGRYKVGLWLKRSSVYAPGPEKKTADWNPGDQPLAGQPIFRQFSGAFNLLLRDGQTIQSAMATDPVSGRVVKVEVTLNVVK